MADIPIERKDNRSIWPWIIGIIVLLLILWFLFGRHRNDNTAATTGADTVMTTPAPATGAGMNAAPATTGTPAAPGTTTPGTTTPGTTTPGSTTPGSTTPGSTTPGSTTPGSTTPGTTTP